MLKALNIYASSSLRYSFIINDWIKTYLENLERKIRTLLINAHKYHPRSTVEQITLFRNLGGGRLLDIDRQLMSK